MNPLLLVLLPLAAAPLVYLLRRWATLAAGLAIGSALSTSALALLGPPTASAQLLGRSLFLDPLSRLAVGFFLLVVAALFVYAWHISQGWSFFPFVLVVMGLLAATLMMQTFVIAVLLLEMASLVLVFLVQAGRTGSTGGALRYLVAVVLATPCFMLVAWLMDLYALHPDNLALIQLIIVGLSLGFGFLLAIAPFHFWLSALAEEAPPMVTALVVTVWQPAVLLLLLELLQRFIWLREDARVFAILTTAGLLAAGVGGLLAAVQRRLGRLLGYAVMADLGVVLVGLGAASPSGAAGAMTHLANRTLFVVLAAACLGTIRHHLTGDTLADLRGVAARMPCTTAGLIISGLALSGLPPLDGFPGRWLVYRAVASSHLPVAAILLLSGAGTLFGYWRAWRALFTPGQSEPEVGEPKVVAGFILVLSLLSLLMGLYPQFILERVWPWLEVLRFLP